MTSERDKCGLTSILPMSCRKTTEAFARRLHSRLRSLGSQDDNDSADESSWLGANDAVVDIAVAQPKLNDMDPNFYLGLDGLESPPSPVNEYNTLINDTTTMTNGVGGLNSDSDSSDGPFYDTEPAPNNNSDELFVTPSDCIQEITSITSELSTLSLRDDAEETTTEIAELPKDEPPEPIPRVRRCSSLKTGKTPPDTPGGKKIVRFADVLGLDLADVRTFLDEIPKVPTSAYDDLKDVDYCTNESSLAVVGTHKFHGIKLDRVLMPLFQQPGGQPDFLDRIRDRNVCLENAMVDDPCSLSVKGTVRVRNLDYHKSVYIRYTLNSWTSYVDVQGIYLANSCDGFSDKFTFVIYAHTLTVGQRLEFAVRFHCKGLQYWDNNLGANYCFQCLPATNPTNYAPIDDAPWAASFYYPDDDDDEKEGAKTMMTSTEIQEIVTNSLMQKRRQRQRVGGNNNSLDVFTVFIILIFSVLFMYIQKGIYFMN